MSAEKDTMYIAIEKLIAKFILNKSFANQLRGALYYNQYQSLGDSALIQTRLTDDHKTNHQRLLYSVEDRLGWVQNNVSDLDMRNAPDMLMQGIYAKMQINLEYYKILISEHYNNQPEDKPIFAFILDSNIKRSIQSAELATNDNPLELISLYRQAVLTLEIKPLEGPDTVVTESYCVFPKLTYTI